MSAGKNREKGTDGQNLPDKERESGQLRLSHEDFQALSLAKIEELSGRKLPDSSDADVLQEYRREAWESYQIDVRNRDEWGTARQGIPLPD